jgi:hypothetical protein
MLPGVNNNFRYLAGEEISDSTAERGRFYDLGPGTHNGNNFKHQV